MNDMGDPIKRYWSAHTPMGFFDRMTKEEAAAWHAFDAKLTRDDVMEMQMIDADCNDCRHFKRGATVRDMPSIYPELQPRILMGFTFFEGHCQKFNRPTRACPMQYTGHECFEHRRSK